MINILLVEKDMNYCKKLINAINLKNENLRICSISSDLNELSIAVSKHHVDIIVMDLNLLEYVKIHEKSLLNKKQFINSIIILLKEERIPDELANNLYIYSCISKLSNSIKKIVNDINCLATYKKYYKLEVADSIEEDKVRKRITDELIYLGYNLSHNGTKYLIETIYILYILDGYYDDNLETDIYPIVAKKFGKNWNNIKCSIRYATEIMSYECEEQKLLDYLYNYTFLNPGPKTIIDAVLGRIK